MKKGRIKKEWRELKKWRKKKNRLKEGRRKYCIKQGSYTSE